MGLPGQEHTLPPATPEQWAAHTSPASQQGGSDLIPMLDTGKQDARQGQKPTGQDVGYPTRAAPWLCR